jgi:hypothetical protein
MPQSWRASWQRKINKELRSKNFRIKRQIKERKCLQEISKFAQAMKIMQMEIGV